MNRMKQAHFFSIPTQGNLYTIKNLHLANDTNKLLIATLKRQVFCFEYVENSAGILIPTAKEISFTYIPSGAEIISLDAFNKSEDKNDFIIGITIIKTSSDNSGLETYLNIYSEWEESQEFNIESIAQNCLTLELSFIPYHLSHTFLVSWQNEKLINKEIIFILTGSDNNIHIYKENAVNHSYKEIDGKEIFPEFYSPPSVVIWVDVHYYNNYAERVSAFGCECGYVRLARVCCKTNTIIFKVGTRFISPISQIKIFPVEKTYNKPGFFRNNDENKTKNEIIDFIDGSVGEESPVNKDILEDEKENVERVQAREQFMGDVIQYESAIIEDQEEDLQEGETILEDLSTIKTEENVCDTKNMEVPRDTILSQEDDVNKFNFELTEIVESLQDEILPTSAIIDARTKSSDCLQIEETDEKSEESSLAATLVESSDTLKEESGEKSSENSMLNVLMESSETSKEEEETGEKNRETLVETSQDVADIDQKLRTEFDDYEGLRDVEVKIENNVILDESLQDEILPTSAIIDSIAKSSDCLQIEETDEKSEESSLPTTLVESSDALKEESGEKSSENSMLNVLMESSDTSKEEEETGEKTSEILVETSQDVLDIDPELLTEFDDNEGLRDAELKIENNVKLDESLQYEILPTSAIIDSITKSSDLLQKETDEKSEESSLATTLVESSDTLKEKSGEKSSENSMINVLMESNDTSKEEEETGQKTSEILVETSQDVSDIDPKLLTEFNDNEGLRDVEVKIKNYVKIGDSLQDEILPTSAIIDSITESGDFLQKEETDQKSEESSLATTLVESSGALKEESGEKSSENSLINVSMESSDTSKEEEETGEKNSDILVETCQDVSDIDPKLFTEFDDNEGLRDVEVKIKNNVILDESLQYDILPTSVIIDSITESSDSLQKEETDEKSEESSWATTLVESSDTLKEESGEKSSENSMLNVLMGSSDTSKEEEEAGEKNSEILVETSQDVSDIDPKLFTEFDDNKGLRDIEVKIKNNVKIDEGIENVIEKEVEECVTTESVESNKKIDPTEGSTIIDCEEMQFETLKSEEVIEESACKDVSEIPSTSHQTTDFRNTSTFVESKASSNETNNPLSSKDPNPQITHKAAVNHEKEINQEHVNTILNLVVVNAVLPSVFFNDIANQGLSVYTTLRRTEMVTVSACVEVADIDFDGTEEILLGSSGEDIKLYVIEDGVAELKEIKHIVSPVFNIQYLDITGDGVKELIIFTMRGVYILQHEAEDVQRILKEKVEKLTIPDSVN